MNTEEKKQLAEKIIAFLDGLSVSDAKDVLRHASFICQDHATVKTVVQEGDNSIEIFLSDDTLK